MTTFGESSEADDFPAGWKAMIFHATLKLDESEVAGADVPPDHYKKTESAYIMMAPKEPEETEKLFATLADNGEVKISFQKMFDRLVMET